MTYFAESLETPSKENALEAEILRRARRLHLFRYNAQNEERSADEQLALAGAERLRCAEDFFYWIDNYGWLHDPHAENADLSIIPFMLWPEQRKLAEWFIEGIETGRNRHLNKARSIGASWLCLHIFMHRFLFHKGFTAKCGSRKEELVDDRTMDSLFGKLRFIYRRQPGFFKPDKKDFIDNYLLLQNATMGSEITGEATNAGFGRGGRKQAVLFDELAWVETAIQAQAWTSLETVARSVIDVSSPNGKGNQFQQNMVRSPAEDCRTINWRANPARTQEWFDGLLIENGGRLTWDQRAQEHDCNFAGVGGYRVLKADRDKITYNDEKLYRLYPKARAEWVLAVAGDVGSGPSQTAFSFALLNWSLGDGIDPLVLIDNEVVRERQTAFDIARDVKLELAEYYGRRSIFGDPASKNVDSAQESWETNLQSGGLSFVALPAWYNDQFAIGETLKDIQRLLDKGLLFVHERCLYAHESIESWEWDIPKGMSIELLSRETLKPKKNVYSHCFPLETEVLTFDGPVKFRDLIGKSGYLPTPYGPKQFDSTKPRMVPELVRVSLSNGVEFECTPDHKLATEDGWVLAGDSLGYDILGTWSQESSLRRFKSSMERDSIVTMAGTSPSLTPQRTRTETGISTELFGPQGMDQFLRVITSTTETATEPTTASAIWSFLVRATTKGFIGRHSRLWKGRRNQTLREPRSCSEWTPQRSGTRAEPGESGTEPTPPRSSASRPSESVQRSASNAEESSSPSSRRSKERDSATSTARCPTIGKMGCRVVSVSRVEGRREVSCLTVFGAGCFYLANGTLVSNCGDSLRYNVGFLLRGLRPGATNPLSRPSGSAPEPKPGEIDRGLKEDEFFKVPTERQGESATSSIRRLSSSLTGHRGRVLDFSKRSREL